MNIVFFSSDNSQASGAFRSMVQLCVHLKNDFGHRPLVILSRKGNGVELLETSDIEYKYVRSFNWITENEDIVSFGKRINMQLKFLANLFISSYLAIVVKSYKANFVHINTSWAYIGALAAKKAGIPYIWHIREFLEEDQNCRIYNKPKGYKLIEGSAAVIAISESIKNKYTKNLNTDKIVTIFNGIDPATFSKESHAIMRSEEVKIAMIGTISESKGQYQLIRAIGSLKEIVNKPIQVKIVGGGAEKYVNQLKEMVTALGLDNEISFVGFQKDATKYYQWADIVCVCSRAEAFGRITVEAMMSGDLVVGADCGATKELIKHGETGLLYRYGDVEDFSKKIKVAINDAEYAQKMACEGKAFMLKNMTSYENARKIDRLYQDVIG